METSKQIGSWMELIKELENTNPYKHTIVVTGWGLSIDGDKTHITRVFIDKKPVDILLTPKQSEKTYVKKQDVCEKIKEKFFKLPTHKRGNIEDFYYEIIELIENGC